MTLVHIYRAEGQPATRFIDANVEPPLESGFPPDQMLWCHSCGECWPASGMSIYVYYDHSHLSCTTGSGCKDPARMAMHKEAERRNRSEGQRERWRKKREQEATP